MADDELLPNPDGCTKFESNPFRKEKCKHCGHPWQMHLGAISQSVVDGFTKQKKDAVAAKAKAEAEAKSKAKAAKKDAKARNAAVEDAWLHDGAGEDDHNDDASSDDDLGFKMFTKEDLASQNAALKPGSKPASSLGVIKNLIDFSECDVDDEPPPPAPVPQQTLNASPAAYPDASPAASSSAHVGSPHGSQIHSQPSSMFAGRPNSNEEAYLAEISHLRQMLDDANEEKNIQVAIVRDEVQEKQSVIDRLSKQNAELEESIRKINEQNQMAATSSPAATDQSERLNEAEQKSKALEQELDKARQQIAEQDQQRAKVVEDFKKEEKEVREQIEEVKTKEIQALRAEIAQLKAAEETRKDAQAPQVSNDAVNTPEMTPEISTLLNELRGLHQHTCRILAESNGARAPEETDATSLSLEEQLNVVKELASAAKSLGERTAADNERLRSLAAKGDATSDEANLAATKAASRVAGRFAKEALRDVRLRTEKQLSWIRERMQKNGQLAQGANDENAGPGNSQIPVVASPEGKSTLIRGI